MKHSLFLCRQTDQVGCAKCKQRTGMRQWLYDMSKKPYGDHSEAHVLNPARDLAADCDAMGVDAGDVIDADLARRPLAEVVVWYCPIDLHARFDCHAGGRVPSAHSKSNE